MLVGNEFRVVFWRDVRFSYRDCMGDLISCVIIVFSFRVFCWFLVGYSSFRKSIFGEGIRFGGGLKVVSLRC